MRLSQTIKPALCLVLALAMLNLVTPANAAENTGEGMPILREIKTEIGDNAISYPQLEGLADANVQQRINDAIVEKAKIAQRMVTLTTLTKGGTGLTVTYDAYLQGNVFSVAVNAVGIMENGRRGQEYTAMGFHLDTGEPLTLADLLTDPQAAVAEMETILTDTYLDELGSYGENASVTPLPTDNFAMDEDGLTFYYPSSQFALFSGYSGAAQFTYDELSAFLRTEPDALPATLHLLPETLSDAQIKAAVAYTASQGELPHVRAKLGDSMQMLIDRYRLLREPDQYPGGRYCQLEAPMFRQVLVMTDALTAGYENAYVSGLLSYRCNLYGLQTGVTAQSRWRQVLGEPQSTVTYNETLATTNGLPVGTADYYDYEGAQLMLYADEAGVLYAVRLTKS